MPKVYAIAPQLSPDLTVYDNGVGVGSGGKVAVGSSDVGVSEGVGDEVEVGPAVGSTIPPVTFRAK